MSEPEISIEGKNIRVQLAGVTSSENARILLSKTASLTFRDLDNNLLMDSSVLNAAKESVDEKGMPAVSLSIKDKDKFYEVQVSMLEIYNEKVQDLLVRPDKRPPSGLKIRESKVLGIFVDGLSKHPVTSYDEISKKMDDGYNNRTIGSTLMNATSSRAHTIVTIEFRQILTVDKSKSEKLSQINELLHSSCLLPFSYTAIILPSASFPKHKWTSKACSVWYCHKGSGNRHYLQNAGL